MISNPKETIEHIVWSDKYEKLGKPGELFARLLRYLYGMLRDVGSNELTFRAMSLVYTTLLSIVPLLAVSFALAKGLGMVEKLRELFAHSFTQLGPDGNRIAENILQMVDRIDGKAIGAIGVIFFLWTAVSMVQKIEASFNYVWYVSKPRSFARRFTEYLIVLLMAPLVMGSAFSMIASLNSNRFVGYLETLPGFAHLFLFVGKSLPYLMIITVFTLLYYSMPNTQVKFRSALVGGIAGGILWATVSVIFTTFIATSFRTFAVYASFGVGVVTLIWLYMNWLVLLLGAQLAFYHQNPTFLRIGRQEPRLSNGMRERIAINIMTAVGHAFRSSDLHVTLKDIGALLSIPTMALAPIADALEAGGLLSQTETEHLIPGRDMSRISLREVVDVVRVLGETGSYRDPTWEKHVNALGKDLDSAIYDVLGDRTVDDFVDEMEQSG